MLPKLDGRRVHVVDRALDYVALADAGLSAARIARKRRRSAGYVSILLRLGRAIATLEPAELAALRSPRVTWKLAQRIVRADADTGSIRHQLRLALGGFSSHNVDRRKHRSNRSPAGAVRPGRAMTSWGWDESWFTRDPLDFVRHHLAHLEAVHRAVATRAARTVPQRAARRLSVGQSLAALQRSLAAAAAPGGDATVVGRAPERQALAALAALERHLAAAAEEVSALLTGPLPVPERSPAAARPEPVPPAPIARSATRPAARDLALQQQIDQELAD